MYLKNYIKFGLKKYFYNILISYIPQEIFQKIMSYNLQPINKFKNGEYNNIYLKTDISPI